jgi:hypothetical protein
VCLLVCRQLCHLHLFLATPIPLTPALSPTHPSHPAQVCGRCWQGVSGGVVDGDAAHPHYRYGGLWRNLHKPK